MTNYKASSDSIIFKARNAIKQLHGENIFDYREPRKIKNFTLTEAYKKTPCGAKGFNKLYITMTELTQAASC